MPLNVKVFVSLLILRGDQFLLLSGLNGGISKNGAWIALHQFVECLVSLKQHFIKMPTRNECVQTARFMKDKFKIKNLALGIDGKLFPFYGKPRFQHAPAQNDPRGQDFWNYHGNYGFTSMVVTDGVYIRDVIAWQPGRMNDAGVYNGSQFKDEWHINYRPFVCCGDSAYPISLGMVTPYSQREVTPGWPHYERNRKFNKRMCGARTVMSEIIFGRLVRMYPVLDNLRYYVEFNQKVVLACMVLFNLRAFLKEEDDEYVPNVVQDDENFENQVAIYQDLQTPNQIRLGGQVARDNLRDDMPD